MDFDQISILYSLGTCYTLWRLATHWHSFWSNPITPQDRILAQQLALFVGVPIGVFFHELGHALATWQVGGRVIDFQWRLFWGYVRPLGQFTPVEYWWISLSGNLVSIALGLIALALVPRFRDRTWGAILEAFAAVQLVFSLVGYPVLSFILPGFSGDWVDIYNFSVSPYAQIVLTIHVLLVVALWRLDRSNRPPAESLQDTPDP